MCLIELGGAWVLEKPTYPIVVPPLTRTQAVAEIGDVHMGQLSSDEEIDPRPARVEAHGGPVSCHRLVAALYMVSRLTRSGPAARR
jgi:hypothetical protein